MENRNMEEIKQEMTEQNEQTVAPEPQPRWKSWAVWASVLGALGLALQAMGILEAWGLDVAKWEAVVTALGVILTTFGILNNPTDKANF